MNTEMESRPNQINIEYINFEQEDSPSLMRMKTESINLEADCHDPPETLKYQSRKIQPGFGQT